MLPKCLSQVLLYDILYPFIQSKNHGELDLDWVWIPHKPAKSPSLIQRRILPFWLSTILRCLKIVLKKISIILLNWSLWLSLPPSRIFVCEKSVDLCTSELSPHLRYNFLNQENYACSCKLWPFLFRHALLVPKRRAEKSSVRRPKQKNCEKRGEIILSFPFFTPA